MPQGLGPPQARLFPRHLMGAEQVAVIAFACCAPTADGQGVRMQPAYRRAQDDKVRDLGQQAEILVGPTHLSGPP